MSFWAVLSLRGQGVRMDSCCRALPPENVALFSGS